jgi:geranylgeranyl reductase family protein
MSRRLVDVLVVGAGPAGAASAALLARQGLDVLAIDRAEFPREKPCSEYMSPEAVRILDHLGALPTLQAAGAVPTEGTDVHAALGNALSGRFAQADVAPPRPSGLAIARRVLDATLVDTARAAGAEIAERTMLESLIVERGAIRGAVVRDPGGRREIRARCVIGADGLRSRVARGIGRRRHGWLRRMAFVAHVADVPGLARSAEMHVGRRGYVGLNPIGHGVVNVALVLPAADAAEAAGRARDFFFERLEQFAGVRGRVRRHALVRDVLVTGPFAATSTRVTADGALLVGDAADFFDPFTGEGICSALRGAELAAAHLPAALDGADVATRQSLGSYLAARRRLFAGKWIVERLIGTSMLWPALFDHAVGRLQRRGMAHTLVGVTADFVPARAVLDPRFLARMLF